MQYSLTIVTRDDIDTDNADALDTAFANAAQNLADEFGSSLISVKGILDGYVEDYL